MSGGPAPARVGGPRVLLLSRALVELHDENGETSGIVTPYTVQAEATKEALRDIEPNGRLLAEVGTAHRFQGREFPVVVFDTVESWDNGNMWIGQASRLPGSNPWQRDGVRLFNVAATRVQHRLYVIASRERVVAGEDRHRIRTPRNAAARQAGARRVCNQTDHADHVGASGPRARRQATGGCACQTRDDHRHPRRAFVLRAVRRLDLPGPELDLAVVCLGRLSRPHAPAAAP